MVVIRLSRTGAKKAPFYHLVATDKRSRRDGRFIERLGYFNPMAQGQAIRLELNQERIQYWLEQGAQPSDRVKTLLKEDAMGAEKAQAKRQAKIDKAQAKKQAEIKAKAAAEAKAAKEAEDAEKAEKAEEAK